MKNLKNLILRVLFVLLLMADSSSVFAESFSFEITNPKVKISIPELPKIVMKPHLLSKTRPHLRYQGSSGSYDLSIITPTADTGMTPLECAQSTIHDIVKRRYGLADSEYKAYKADDGKTFALYYSIRFPPFTQLKAHLISAASGHCIEVHISKVLTSQKEAKNWFGSFPQARIQTGK
ncbi:MAG: hypothetical protein HYU97_07020 [Deltaproteobacteria bacterium]|nr:hypothetical protein [Deltaproteobacteria bacterium]